MQRQQSKVKTLQARMPAPTRPAYVHLAAFLLPVLGLGLAFAAVGVYPFGDNSSLTLDLRSQYITFFVYLRDEVFLGGGDLLYTFSKALGGDMAGFAAYYLFSPFNLLLLPFSAEMMPLGVTVVELCKVGCAGFTMSVLLNRRGARWESLLFTLPYALMDFVVAFHFNVMWLDGVILLPLVVLGIEKLLAGGSPLPYVLSLAAAIVTNYYIGYMLCLFSALYFVVFWLFFAPARRGLAARRVIGPAAVGADGGTYGMEAAAAAKEAERTAQAAQTATSMGQGGKARFSLTPLLRFGVASLLAGGLSAAVLLPVVFSLRGGKAGVSLSTLLDKSYATLADVIARYMPGTASNAQVFFGYPAIYCGMLAMVCALLFLTSRRIPGRVRLGGGVLLAALVLSFCMGPLDRLWHGLNKPVGFLYRYSFVFSFVLLYLGWQGFCQLRGRVLRRTLPVILGGTLLMALVAHRDSHEFSTLGKWLLGFGALAAVSLLLVLYAGRKWRYSVLMLAAVVLLDMGGNLYLSLRRVDYYPMSEYRQMLRDEQSVIDGIKGADDNFYRLEKSYSFSDDDAFLYGYNGLSHFSSADKMFVRELLDDLGLSDGGYGVKYADGTTVGMESLLSLKYLVTGTGGTVKPYTLLEEADGHQVWQNPYALPVGFAAGVAPAEMPQGGTVFDRYNTIWQAVMSSAEHQLYRPAQAEEVPQGVARRAEDFDGEALYDKTAEGGYLEYLIEVDSDDMLYAYFATANERNVDVWVNGENWGRFLYNDRHGVLALGRFAPGTTVSVRLAPNGWELLLAGAQFAYEDMDLLAETAAAVNGGVAGAAAGVAKAAPDGTGDASGADLLANSSAPRATGAAYRLDNFSSSHFDGLVTGDAAAGRDHLLLSIPYDAGWQVWLDGERVPTQQVLGGLTAIELPDGEHRVRSQYVPPGMWPGVIITVASAALLALWLVLARRRRMAAKAGTGTALRDEAPEK